MNENSGSNTPFREVFFFMAWHTYISTTKIVKPAPLRYIHRSILRHVARTSLPGIITSPKLAVGRRGNKVKRRDTTSYIYIQRIINIYDTRRGRGASQLRNRSPKRKLENLNLPYISTRKGITDVKKKKKTPYSKQYMI